MKTLTNVLYSLLYKCLKGVFIENPLKVCGGIGCFSFRAFSFCCGVLIHSSLNCCGVEKISSWWRRNNFFHIFRSFQIWTELHMLIRWRNFVLLIEVSLQHKPSCLEGLCCKLEYQANTSYHLFFRFLFIYLLSQSSCCKVHFTFFYLVLRCLLIQINTRCSGTSHCFFTISFIIVMFFFLNSFINLF